MVGAAEHPRNQLRDAVWIEQHVPRERRLQAAALFLNPSSGNRWTPPCAMLWTALVGHPVIEVTLGLQRFSARYGKTTGLSKTT